MRASTRHRRFASLPIEIIPVLIKRGRKKDKWRRQLGDFDAFPALLYENDSYPAEIRTVRRATALPFKLQ